MWHTLKKKIYNYVIITTFNNYKIFILNLILKLIYKIKVSHFMNYFKSLSIPTGRTKFFPILIILAYTANWIAFDLSIKNKMKECSTFFSLTQWFHFHHILIFFWNIYYEHRTEHASYIPLLLKQKMATTCTCDRLLVPMEN